VIILLSKAQPPLLNEPFLARLSPPPSSTISCLLRCSRPSHHSYRNGHIGASEEGHNRVIDFLDVFDGDLGDTDEVSGEWEWFDHFYILLLHVLYTR
jgi:hypothetical protein